MFRRNAIVLPLYQLILAFIFFVGFAAVLKVPGLSGPNIDLSLFRLSIATFAPWFVGVIGAAGVLTALVPGSMIMMTAATLLANNIYRAGACRPPTDATHSRPGESAGAGGGAGRGPASPCRAARRSSRCC